MKYYIVALFDEETYQIISPIQKGMSKKFKFNRNSPQPFIPITYVESANIDKLLPIMDKLVSPFKTFRINVSDLIYLWESNKSLNLKIDNKGYIKKLSRIFSDTLITNGFNAKPIGDNSICLSTLTYLAKDYKKQDIKLNFPEIYTDSFIKLRVQSIEIWKLPIQKKNTPIKSYRLKDF